MRRSETEWPGVTWLGLLLVILMVCAPARAALLTGRYPQRTGVVTLNMERYPTLTRLKRDEVTLAERFRAAGYRTGIVGKWHVGSGEAWHPRRRGFDEAVVFTGHTKVPSYSKFELDVNGEPEQFAGEGDYLTTELSERAIEFVRRHRDRPFFLHLAHYAPHRPLAAPAERVRPYLERGLEEEVATVYAMIEIMDEGIGDLLGTIDELRIADETVVVFASDNGPDPLVAARFGAGLRGAKYEVHEGGIRVPFWVRWPGRYAAGERGEPVHFVDVLPTLVDVCALPEVEGRVLDGVSLRSVLEGGEFTGAPRYRFWQWNRREPLYSHNAAVREGRWKLVRPFVTKNLPKGESALAPMLFDLEADPGERVDVAGEHADKVTAMDAALDRWAREVEAERGR